MFDLISLIKTVGYLGIFGIVFAESGLFIGFFLPGDSLLFTAGFLGYLNIYLLIFLCVLGAVLGDNFGYAFGAKVGPKIFKREDSFLFHKDQLERAKNFYEKYGVKTIVLARFIPFVRTFAPILAGVGKMNYPTFLFYNFIGAFLWGIGIPLFGFFLGTIIPNADTFILPIIGLIVVGSVIPVAMELYKIKNKQKF